MILINRVTLTKLKLLKMDQFTWIHFTINSKINVGHTFFYGPILAINKPLNVNFASIKS